MQLSELSPLETPPQKPQPKRQETEEERQRRRSASYARMLTRMKRHYEAVQVNGSHAHPATAPPRRQRAVRRAKSVASHHFRADLANDSHVETALVVTDLVSADPFKNDPVNSKAADLTVDLAYLNVYKDAR
ncbi:hypothetical protein PHYBOEH_004818 [Phytophthora boehmeriae]|uniref:Uncharacterized protein n=1 Tax=Phytophthora boehmeriae TaxID=109152 RepID=A0A8T1WQ78_9STRA|nr:hypothetical protein PHYBOEH_004818 [Phytophthora boehmeriae]